MPQESFRSCPLFHFPSTIYLLCVIIAQALKSSIYTYLRTHISGKCIAPSNGIEDKILLLLKNMMRRLSGCLKIPSGAETTHIIAQRTTGQAGRMKKLTE
jgi:hypothetical protein